MVELIYLWKCLEFGEIGKKAEELHGDTRRDDQQARGKDNETAQLFARTKDLVYKVF